MASAFFRTVVAATVAILFSAPGAQAASEAALPTVSFVRFLLQVPAGVQWHDVQRGAFCATTATEKSDGRATVFNLAVLGPAFSQNFTSPDAVLANRSLSLFGDTNNPTAADFQIGGIARDMHVNTCVQGILGVRDEVTMSIEWQVYSPSKGQVVATVQTSGAASQKLKQVQNADAETMRMAFEENVRRLAASPELKRILSTRST